MITYDKNNVPYHIGKYDLTDGRVKMDTAYKNWTTKFQGPLQLFVYHTISHKRPMHLLLLLLLLIVVVAAAHLDVALDAHAGPGLFYHRLLCFALLIPLDQAVQASAECA